MHTNALANEKSPYLRQHANNPVDWLPWGEAAFEKSRKEDKPIFLSIGYSTCHWCHVMAHESFEDERVAEVLNRDFVPIKLDREERPDVDRIYMLFVQATTGGGGWPMSVWLTPDLRPFFGGTYFPPDQRYGRPGFRDVLLHLAHAWKQERQRIETSSIDVARQLEAITAAAPTSVSPDREVFASAFWQLRRTFDPKYGGFGGAPKFPRPVVLNYLLRYYAAEKSDEALEMVTRTLDGMAAGGMHDHLGGGFHRYSVDERWFVPHFEKMMYDQAQLAVSYLETFQVTRELRLARAARDIFEYVRRDMTDDSGAFFSAEDADSPDPDRPGHSGEGAFYIWRQTEIERLLGKNAAEFCNYFGVQEYGNVANDPQGEFVGRNILFRPIDAIGEPEPESISSSKRILFEARSKRPRPHLDDKILTSWNALMISAFCAGARVLGEQQYLDAAERAMASILSRMYDGHSGELLRRYCDGEAAVPAFLDDYAFLAQAAIDLFETTFKPKYLALAADLARRGLTRFEDREQGGFFSTVQGEQDLLLRMKDDYDGAEPSGNSVATDVLLRLAHITGDDSFNRSAQRSLQAFTPKLQAQPAIAPQMLVAVNRWLSEPAQVVVRCESLDDDVRQLIRTEQSVFNPQTTVLAISDEAARELASLAGFLGGLERRGRMTVYRCRNFTCDLPEVIA